MLRLNNPPGCCRISISNREQGFTLLEIVMAAVILAAVMAGLTATFISAKKRLLHSKSTIQAAEIARGVLEGLHIYVREDTWDSSGTNKLTVPHYPDPEHYPDPADLNSKVTVPPLDNNGIAYDYSWDVSGVHSAGGADSSDELRKVDVKISWTEP